jgi:hypothetical protein
LGQSLDVPEADEAQQELGFPFRTFEAAVPRSLLRQVEIVLQLVVDLMQRLVPAVGQGLLELELWQVVAWCV